LIRFGGPGSNDRFTNNTSTPIHIQGGGGDDTLSGGSGDDILFGDRGVDTVFGRGGNDSCIAESEFTCEG
jgi:Ca2+-binding RTX toxin-like protein